MSTRAPGSAADREKLQASIESDGAFRGVEPRTAPFLVRHRGHDARDRVLVAGVERGVRRGAVTHAAVPVHPVVRLLDRLDLVLTPDRAVAMDTALGAEGRVLPPELEGPFVAAVADHVAGAVAEVGRVADHQTLRVLPERLHLVRRGERVLVLPRVDTAQAHASLRDAEAGDEVGGVEEVHGPLGHRALRELPVAIPG